MGEKDKINIVICILISIISGLLLATFDPEVNAFTRAIRENSFETIVVLFLILIVGLLLHLTAKKDEKTSP